jgi:predicted secreted protein
MPFIHSKESVFYLDNAAGALQNISTFVDKVSTSFELDETETTTFGASFRTYIPGFAEATIKISGNWDRTFDVQMAALVEAFRAGTIATNAVTFQYGPEGSTAGDKQITGECILTNYEVESSVQDQVTWTAELRPTGTITHTTY